MCYPLRRRSSQFAEVQFGSGASSRWFCFRADSTLCLYTINKSETVPDFTSSFIFFTLKFCVDVVLCCYIIWRSLSVSVLGFIEHIVTKTKSLFPKFQEKSMCWYRYRRYLPCNYFGIGSIPKSPVLPTPPQTGFTCCCCTSTYSTHPHH